MLGTQEPRQAGWAQERKIKSQQHLVFIKPFLHARCLALVIPLIIIIVGAAAVISNTYFVPASFWSMGFYPY